MWRGYQMIAHYNDWIVLKQQNVHIVTPKLHLPGGTWQHSLISKQNFTSKFDCDLFVVSLYIYNIYVYIYICYNAKLASSGEYVSGENLLAHFL